MSFDYSAMLHLPRPRSQKHPPMDMMARAAQFAPFAALTGHSDAIAETARLTDSMPELDEYEKEKINAVLNRLLEQQQTHPAATITYFQPDAKKQGGACITCMVRIKDFDLYEKHIRTLEGRFIPIEQILEVSMPAEDALL